MLKIIVPSQELFDNEKNIFFKANGGTLELEHSLISISKWESYYCKPFITNQKKTNSEMKYYIKCMTIRKNGDDAIYDFLTKDNYTEIGNYMEAPMTATKIVDRRSGGRRQVTSELIYYWMFSYGIPIECEKWHFNRLMALIRLCNVENEPPKKMSKSAIYAENRKINAMNRAKFHSRG